MTKQPTAPSRNFLQPHIACGVDLVEYEKFSRIINVGKERYIQAIYTEHEQSYCAGDLHKLSARWAAKEAVVKALGTGFRNGINPIDVEIEHRADGRPVLRLHKRAKTMAESRELFTWSVSLSHEKQYAIAMAVALRQGVAEDAEVIDAVVATQAGILQASALTTLQAVLESIGTQ